MLECVDCGRRSDSWLSYGGGVHGRQERSSDVRGTGTARSDGALLGHRRQRHRGHRGHGHRRVLVTQHGTRPTTASVVVL